MSEMPHSNVGSSPMHEAFFRALVRFGAKEAEPSDYGYHCQIADTDADDLAARIVGLESRATSPEWVPPCQYFIIGGVKLAFDLKEQGGRLILL